MLETVVKLATIKLRADTAEANVDIYKRAFSRNLTSSVLGRDPSVFDQSLHGLLGRRLGEDENLRRTKRVAMEGSFVM